MLRVALDTIEEFPINCVLQRVERTFYFSHFIRFY